MTIINNITKGMLLCAAVVGSLILSSCADEPDKFESTKGKPTVKFVRNLTGEIKNVWDAPETVYTIGQLITEAEGGNTVALIGENMRSVYEIWFNDQQASLNQSTLTDNVLITTIPNKVPGQVFDKIFLVTTEKDTVDYDFHVVIPAPVLASTTNEYDEPGTEITIKGNYFIDDPNVPLTVSFTNNNGGLTKATITSIADDYTSVNVVIPDDAAAGPIIAESVYGSAKSEFYYKDNRGMLFDFDTPNPVTGTVLGNHGWHSRTITNENSPLSGNYVELSGGSFDEDAGWNDGSFSFEYWAGGAWGKTEDYSDAPRLTDIVSFADWENMALKFEMYVPSSNPWSAGAMQIIWGNTTQITGGEAGNVDIYGKTVAGANNTFFNNNTFPRALYRPWTTTGSYDTGDKWVTVTIPLQASLVYGFEGLTIDSPEIDKDFFSSLTLFVVGGGVKGTACEPVIRIDNIRVVPIK